MLKKTLASLLLTGSLLACGDAPQVIVQAPSPVDVEKPGHFVVQGTATIDVSPDCADVTMTISADAPKPGSATTSVQQKEQKLIAALLALGLENPDLKRSHLTLEPVYAQTPEGWAQLKVATYRARITITATTKKFDLVAPMMEAGGEAGASAMSTAFRRSDMSDLKRRVREMALAQAKEKAAQTAKVLGVDLGRIVSISETPSHYFAQPYLAKMDAAEADVARATAITLGGATQPLTFDVSIGFELPRKA
jgi:uncharacterized protein YggE